MGHSNWCGEEIQLLNTGSLPAPEVSVFPNAVRFPGVLLMGAADISLARRG